MHSSVTQHLIRNYKAVIVTNWLCRGLSISIQIATIPLLSKYLNINQFATYSVITSLSVWFQLFDFGIGNAAQNLISEEKIRQSSATESVVDLVLVLCWGIMLIGFIVAIPLGGGVQILVNPNRITVDNQSSYLIFSLVCILHAGAAVFSILQKVMYALNLGVAANLISAGSSIISFFFLFIFTRLNPNLDRLFVVLVANLGPSFLFALVALVIYGNIPRILRSSKEYFGGLKHLWSKSWRFWLISVMSTLTLNVDYMIMSQMLSASDIAKYNMLYRMFFVFLTVFAGALSATWPLFSQHGALQNYIAIYGIIKKLITGAFVALFLFVALLYFNFDTLLSIFAQAYKLRINNFTFLLIGLYLAIRVWTDSFSAALQATNNLGIYFYLVPAQAAISVVMQIWLAVDYGIDGIFMGLILSFVMTAAWILPAVFFLKMRKSEAV